MKALDQLDTTIQQRMVEASDLVTVALDQLLPRTDGPESRLIEAMRYAVLGPGRRIRPYFTLETARMLDVEERSVLRTACALECVHAYSLIHDDLPALDDDDVRAAGPPCTEPMTRRPPCWRGMRCSLQRSRSWPIPTPTRTPSFAVSWCGSWPWRLAPKVWREARCWTCSGLEPTFELLPGCNE